MGAVYEFGEHSLRDEVAARIQEGKVFKEKEIWSIVCSCAIVMGYLQRSGVGYRSVTTEDVFLTEEGVVRMADPEVCGIGELGDPKLYYPPEFLSSHRESPNGVVFSLGMCIM